MCLFGSLFGFGIGMTDAVFHIVGMMLWFSERLYNLVRYCIACGPRCLRCLMLIRSGPSELFVLLFLLLELSVLG